MQENSKGVKTIGPSLSAEDRPPGQGEASCEPRMSQTQGERARRYRERIRSAPQLNAAHLAKGRRRWREKKESGKIRSIKDMSPEEQEIQRMIWRLLKNRSRQKKRQSTGLESGRAVGQSIQSQAASQNEMPNLSTGLERTRKGQVTDTGTCNVDQQDKTFDYPVRRRTQRTRRRSKGCNFPGCEHSDQSDSEDITHYAFREETGAPESVPEQKFDSLETDKHSETASSYEKLELVGIKKDTTSTSQKQSWKLRIPNKKWKKRNGKGSPKKHRSSPVVEDTQKALPSGKPEDLAVELGENCVLLELEPAGDLAAREFVPEDEHVGNGTAKKSIPEKQSSYTVSKHSPDDTQCIQVGDVSFQSGQKYIILTPVEDLLDGQESVILFQQSEPQRGAGDSNHDGLHHCSAPAPGRQQFAPGRQQFAADEQQQTAVCQQWDLHPKERKQRLSAAQRQRRYMERLCSDPTKREAFLQREKQRYRRRIQDGTIKNIRDMNPQEKELQRQKWRESQMRYSRKKASSTKWVEGQTAAGRQQQTAGVCQQQDIRPKERKQRLSAAQRQRRYMERLCSDPTKREAFLQREKQRYLKRIQDGTTKNIRDMSPQEQELQRQKWRERKRRYRTKRASSKKWTKEQSAVCQQQDPSQKEQRQRLLSAQRQRRYRKRLLSDPTKREAFLQREKQRYMKRIQGGAFKMIGEMNPQERELQRQKWRETQRLYRAKRASSTKWTVVQDMCTPLPGSMKPERRGRKRTLKQEQLQHVKPEVKTEPEDAGYEGAWSQGALSTLSNASHQLPEVKTEPEDAGYFDAASSNGSQEHRSPPVISQSTRSEPKSVSPETKDYIVTMNQYSDDEPGS